MINTRLSKKINSIFWGIVSALPLIYFLVFYFGKCFDEVNGVQWDFFNGYFITEYGNWTPDLLAFPIYDFLDSIFNWRNGFFSYFISDLIAWQLFVLFIRFLVTIFYAMFNVLLGWIERVME